MHVGPSLVAMPTDGGMSRLWQKSNGGRSERLQSNNTLDFAERTLGDRVALTVSGDALASSFDLRSTEAGLQNARNVSGST